jgi:hypothetical protein
MEKGHEGVLHVHRRQRIQTCHLANMIWPIAPLGTILKEMSSTKKLNVTVLFVWYMFIIWNNNMWPFFHIRTVIIPRERYRTEGFNSRVDIGRGMITVLIRKKACINLFITYFNIELKRTTLTSHTKLWVIDIGWGMITVLKWKKACIVLLIKRLDIILF